VESCVSDGFCATILSPGGLTVHDHNKRWYWHLHAKQASVEPSGEATRFVRYARSLRPQRGDNPADAVEHKSVARAKMARKICAGLVVTESS
jgi:hypothetical protein